MVPLVERLVAEGITVSVDTWKPEVAEAVLAAGAAMINDVSGLRDPAIADACARHDAGLVVMHTRAEPKVKSFPGYDDVIEDVRAFLVERIELARSRGVADDKIVIDPGPDFAKTPEETVEVLRRLNELRDLEYPMLLALSRKDFVGALTGRRPADRLAGTLGAIAVVARDERHPARARRRRRRRLPARARGARGRPGQRAGARRGAQDRGWIPMSAFTIAQISDIHCGSPHFVPSLLERAIGEINELAPDMVIVSGDLTAEGFREEYELAREYLDRLECDDPIVIPGNHDSRNVGYVHFEELFGERRREVHRDGVSVVAIDSTEPDVDHGTIGRGRYGWIEERFASQEAFLRIFVLHHHLLPVPGTGRERNVVHDAGRRPRVPAAQRRPPRALRPQARPVRVEAREACSS